MLHRSRQAPAVPAAPVISASASIASAPAPTPAAPVPTPAVAAPIPAAPAVTAIALAAVPAAAPAAPAPALPPARALAAAGTPVSPPACAAKKAPARRSLNSLTLSRRIAQDDLPLVAQSWQNLCLVAGGDITTGEPCVKLAGKDGIDALLAAADPCAQQDNADAMIDFAKKPDRKPEAKQGLIDNAIAYRKHPRNALNINGVTPSTPFCDKAPKNDELKGVVNGQLAGVDPGLFGNPKLGIFAFGDRESSRPHTSLRLLTRISLARTCPFGQKPNVDTCTCA